MINLITTDSYFNLFPTLIGLIKDKGNGIEQKNIVFCEEKVSLMIERMLCYETGGSFNTEVYSFGNFLRVKKPDLTALSKEGCAMVVKRILSNVNLTCFKASRQTLAPTLAELIMQLKSAKVAPNDLLVALEKCEGVLKNKLTDIHSIFCEYERFIAERGIEDQSSSLSYLTEVIEKSEEIKKANVFIIGFSGFTAQIRSAIEALFDNAKSVTAILTEGENELVFVNETADYIRKLATEKGLPILSSKLKSDYTKEGEYIVNTLFCINKKRSQKEKQTDSVYLAQPLTAQKEIERVGQIIKKEVIEKRARYRDFTIAIPDANLYGDYIKDVFDKLEIPYFLDERKKPNNHPLITLICAYLDMFKKNFERNTVCAFFKNPLFESDKTLTDEFENYLIKYNVNYSKINKPFTLFKQGKDDLEKLEAFRQRVSSFFDKCDVRTMLSRLEVDKKMQAYSALLKDMGEVEECAINEQVLNAVNSILTQMESLLQGVNLSVLEYKNVFLSGINALELSIIPQYNDAVFIGAYKQTGLAKAKYLFAVGLTAEVPAVQADVALLSDADIDRLESVKLLIEPKIRIVNHRMRENIALALSAYSERLYVTCPLLAHDGNKCVNSEIFTHVKQAFDCLPLPEEQEYLTYKQGINSFAKDSGLFIERQSDFINASSFYHAVGGDKLDKLLDSANKQVQIKLNLDDADLIGDVVSPTTIEDYFKCPYRAFLSHKIRLKPREQGSVEAFSAGTIFHEIFSRYTKEISKVYDIESSNELVCQIFDEIISRNEYKRFLEDSVTKATMHRLLRESKKYCYKTYLYLTNSEFIVESQEKSFGDREYDYYPAVNLIDGKVKIRGKIDRVDCSQNYFRVLDYKTGKADIADKNLYSGVKLQLYLYAAAVKQKQENKQLAGVYYLPVSDKYENADEKSKALAVGKTLDDEQALYEQIKDVEQNQSSEFLTLKQKGGVSNSLKTDALDSFVEYAVKLSELGAKQMKEGVIIPSASEGTCKYCDFKDMCALKNVYERKVESVDENTIFLAVKGGVEDAELD